MELRPPPLPGLLPLQKEFTAEQAKWLEEQRKGKKTIAIVGFAPTTRDLAPFDVPDIEIWALNEAYAQDDWLKRWDRWFQIHKPWSYRRKENRNDPNHWYWLQNSEGQCHACRGTGKSRFKRAPDDIKDCEWCNASGYYKPDRRTDFPIYMQDADPDVPGAVRFPLEEIMDMFLGNFTGGMDRIEYFTSSYAYMASLALYLWKTGEWGDVPLRVETYGFEMSTDTEYHYQKGSTEFWMGMMGALGVDVWVPEYCKLLYGRKYGYEVTQMINRQELEARKRQIEVIENEKVAALNQVSGQRQQAEKEGQKSQKRLQAARERLSKDPTNEKLERLVEDRVEEVEERLLEYNGLMQQEVNALSEANAVAGAGQEIEALIAYIDTQYDFTDDENIRIPVPKIMRKETNAPRTQEEENKQT